jgi:hypothetical protein
MSSKSSRATLPAGEIFAVDRATSNAASAAFRRGTLRRIVQGVYTRDLTTPLEVLVRVRLPEVIAAVRPGAVIVDRSASLGGRPTADGLVFLAHRTPGDVVLPGSITLRCRKGAGALESDTHLPYGIAISGEARLALENLVDSRSRGGRTARTLSRAEIEAWLDRNVSRRGDDWALRLRDDARRIAPELGLDDEFTVLDGLIGALLGTRTTQVVSQQLRARMRGQAHDSDRLQEFDRLLIHLLSNAPPTPLPSLEGARQAVLPFVEAYFSNFIEGTEFDFKEAAAIVYEGSEPASRPADAHDIRGTYAITSDVTEMRRTPTSGDDLVDILKQRHAIVLGGRPEKRPGEFKEEANRAGSTVFVAPRLVAGTLRAGFERYAQLDDPFARAAFMMFLVSEVHPFDDGNGRVARLMMNAELVVADQARIIIPTVYRDNYVMALKGLTQNSNARSYVSMLTFAQRYTAQLDCSKLDAAQQMLEATHAFAEPNEAELAGQRLVLPTSLGRD